MKRVFEKNANSRANVEAMKKSAIEPKLGASKELGSDPN
jgi:hypothetical protein